MHCPTLIGFFVTHVMEGMSVEETGEFLGINPKPSKRGCTARASFYATSWTSKSGQC